jgi:hypothetical protein
LRAGGVSHRKTLAQPPALVELDVDDVESTDQSRDAPESLGTLIGRYRERRSKSLGQ